MKDRILHMLAQGLKGSQIASVIGCSAGYITQVAKEETSAGKIAEYRREYFGEDAGKDKDGEILTSKYNAIEHSLLEKIGDQLQYAELPALTKTLEVIGNRQEKRLARLAGIGAGGGGNQVHVTLVLPSHARLEMPSYEVNENKEVIAIAGREMAPMSSEGVKNLFMGLSGKGIREKEEAIEVKAVDISGPNF